MKKIISILVLVVMIFANIPMVFAGTGYSRSDIDNYVGKKIVDLNYYHSSKGYYPYKKRLDSKGNMQCVGFAYARLEEKLGLSPDFSSGAGAKDIPSNAPNGATRTAIDGSKYTIEVYKNDGGSHITSNCWVSFGAGSSKYGHVIYVEEVIGDNVYYTESGTNMWKNGTAGTLKKRSKYNFINNCSSGGKYVGTIVFRKSGTKEPVPTQAPAKSTLSINITSYPTTITQGSSFGLRGTVSSNYKLTSVNGYILSSDGKTIIQGAYDKQNKYSVDIRTSVVNSNLVFGKLAPGSYIYKVTAWDESGANKEWSKAFTVQAKNNTNTSSAKPSNTARSTSIKISLDSYPKGNLPYGKSFTLSGKFTSDCAIVEARAYLLDANKNVVMEAKGSSTTSNYYIKGYALDKGMKFNKLNPGGYYLKYYVKDANGDTATWISDKFYIVK